MKRRGGVPVEARVTAAVTARENGVSRDSSSPPRAPRMKPAVSLVRQFGVRPPAVLDLVLAARPCPAISHKAEASEPREHHCPSRTLGNRFVVKGVGKIFTADIAVSSTCMAHPTRTRSMTESCLGQASLPEARPLRPSPICEPSL